MWNDIINSDCFWLYVSPHANICWFRKLVWFPDWYCMQWWHRPGHINAHLNTDAEIALNNRFYMLAWWRHQMETFSSLLAICGREFTGHRWIPRTKASDAGLWFFSLICPWINGWVNNREAGDLRRHCAHYDTTVMDRIPVTHSTSQEIYNYLVLSCLCCIYVIIILFISISIISLALGPLMQP